jgi:chemotaxis methyl-accepting protein methylase
MHKLMIGGTILEHELSEMRLLVERQTGVLLDCPNSALAAHIADYIESHELESAAALLDRFRSGELDPATLPQFLEGLVNSNTGFFRHPGAMNALRKQVLPLLYARKSAESPGTLRIWSAGCGTGEEAYSIAMAICESLPASNGAGSCNGAGNGSSSNGNGGKEKAGVVRSGGIADTPAQAPAQLTAPLTKEWSIQIVGSDLLGSAIETAERGLYPQSGLTGLPPALIRASFSKIGATNGNGTAQAAAPNGSASPAGSHLLVKPRLRSLVTFNTMNLTRPVYIGRFDCIFCMDVLPHLSRSQRTALIERLHLYLEPGGYLFLSQTEKLYAPNLNFRSETFDGYTFHRKPLAASAAYGR